VKFWVVLEGRDAEVEARAENGVVVLEVDGRRLEADFRPLPDGEVYSLLVNGRHHEVRIAPEGDHLEVTVNGTTFPVEVRHPIEKALQSVSRGAAARAGETLVAPMPGLVVAIRVRVGEVVGARQPLCVIEAMKMQNELTARGGGIVSEILVAERATVAAGQPLIRIKPETA
jgi:biotin carboxyl carrier protein